LMYGWAMNAQDQPIPISQAQRTETYYCPVCRGEMIPKMGDIKQHHFAHLNLVDCSPENVAKLVAGKWLANTLRQYLAQSKPVNVTWKSQDATEEHTVNILDGIRLVLEGALIEKMHVDIALTRPDGKASVAILTGIEGHPSAETVRKLTEQQIMVILLNPVGVRSGRISLDMLMQQATIWGGWWLLFQFAGDHNFITDAPTLRSLLRVVANRPPYRYYRELHKDGSLSHVLDIEGQKAWLPPEVWQDTIGGTFNKLSPQVNVITQDWQQDDGSTISLFYVTARDTGAIAVRYFAPGQPVVSNINSGFRLSKASALDVAQQLAGGAMSYPI
jgi:hypothetical protein